MNKRFVFGPVASRRLGVSLGVDLVMPKTCSLNCVYCEAGETTRLTLERGNYVDCERVIAELEDTLASHPRLDFITFSGAGEPTLNAGIGQVARYLKEHYPQYPICLLTNACAFDDDGLLTEIADIDLVVPSLDASSEEEFRTINRPAPGMTFARLLTGLRKFCAGTKAKVYLELFIVPGVNDSDESIARFAELVKTLKIDKVQLNTLDRPGCVDWIKPSTAENTRRFIAVLEPICPVEAVGPFRYKSADLRAPVARTAAICQILELARRRPVTLPDLVLATGVDEKTLAKHLDDLVHAGHLSAEKEARGVFYRTN